MKQKIKKRLDAIKRSIEGMDRRGFYKPDKWKENLNRKKKRGSK